MKIAVRIEGLSNRPADARVAALVELALRITKPPAPPPVTPATNEPPR